MFKVPEVFIPSFTEQLAGQEGGVPPTGSAVANVTLCPRYFYSPQGSGCHVPEHLKMETETSAVQEEENKGGTLSVGLQFF